MIRTLIHLLSLPWLFVLSTYYWRKADKKHLPAGDLFLYGRRAGFSLVKKGKLSPKLLINPVSIVRYFEFEYVRSVIALKPGLKMLDVSSPYLMTFYLLDNEEVQIKYINPDSHDLRDVESKGSALSFKGTLETEVADAVNFQGGLLYDRIFSISVIEHVVDDGDSQFISSLWQRLKPGGLLILTFPVKAQFETEFVDHNIYGLQGINQEKYFFQRFYDEEAIEKRLLSPIRDGRIVSKKIFGEKDRDFYSNYHKRWNARKYFETVKDPFYIAKYFREFDSTSDLPGIGVMGLAVEKPK